MDILKTRELPESQDFRRKSTLGVAIISVLLLAPFSLNNFLQGHLLLGGGSLVIVVILAVNAWVIYRGRFYPLVTLLTLIPATLYFLVLSLHEQGIIGALWCYPALLAFYFMLPERMAWVSNLVLLSVIIPQAWDVFDHALAARVAATLLAVSVFSAIFVRVMSSLQNKLHSLAVTDSLTGVYNRLPLERSLEESIQHSNRTREPMTLLLLDLDHFKKINDRLGHDAGDIVLRSVGKLLRDRLRSVDKVFRMGGEEFLVLLFGASSRDGLKLGEELRAAIEALHPLPDQTITASIGLSTLQAGEPWSQWLKRGDENLYRAKLEGRNLVIG